LSRPAIARKNGSNFFAAFLTLFVLEPMRQGTMAEGLFPDALGITRA
jgi:hypothetical protein